MEVRRLIDRFYMAWSCQGEAAQASLLQSVWTEDSVFADSVVVVTGHRELQRHIARIRHVRPGASIRRSSEVDLQHQCARYTWVAVTEDGGVMRCGMDFALVDERSARLVRVVSFPEPLRHLSAGGAHGFR